MIADDPWGYVIALWVLCNVIESCDLQVDQVGLGVFGSNFDKPGLVAVSQA